MLRLARLVPLLLLLAALAPVGAGAAAFDDGGGLVEATALPVSRCPVGVGVAYGNGGNGGGVCVVVEHEAPSSIPPDPLFPSTRACGPGQHGTNITWLNSSLGLCYTLVIIPPTSTQCLGNNPSSCVGVSITDCEPTYNVDPAVYLFNGAIVACAFTYDQLPANPGADIDGDLSPCEGGPDPVFFVDDGYVRICVHIY